MSTTHCTRKGIILAGGSGTRLHPATLALSKQLLPVYDKPMVYYPLSTLMLAGIRDILLISTPQDTPRFQALLGDGSQWGMNLSYCVQPSPDGLAQAFILGRDFVGGQPSALVLGDNIFYGHDFQGLLHSAAARTAGRHGLRLPRARPASATAWSSSTRSRRALSIEEKPTRAEEQLRGHRACTSTTSRSATSPRASSRRARGELEITEVNARYLRAGPARGRDHGPRLRLARHRHARQPARSRRSSSPRWRSARA